MTARLRSPGPRRRRTAAARSAATGSRRIANGDTLDAVFTPTPTRATPSPASPTAPPTRSPWRPSTAWAPGPDSSASAPVTPRRLRCPARPSGVTATAQDAYASASAGRRRRPTAARRSPATGHTVHRRQRWLRSPRVDGDQLPRDRAHQRHGVHVHGRRTKLGWTGPASAQTPPVTPRAALSQYTDTIFSDGFESGTLSNWNTRRAPALVSRRRAAHTGGSALRVATLETQYAYDVKALNGSIDGQPHEFLGRTRLGARAATVAQARDSSSSINMWMLMYDGTRHGLILYPYNSAGASTEIFTGVELGAPAVSGHKVQVQYTGTARGTARIYVNGADAAGLGPQRELQPHGQPADHPALERGAGEQRLRRLRGRDVPPPGAQPPGAPTNVTGTRARPRRAARLDRAGERRRQHHHGLQDQRVRQRAAAVLAPDRLRGDDLPRRRPRQRHDVHLHRRRASTRPARARSPRRATRSRLCRRRLRARRSASRPRGRPLGRADLVARLRRTAAARSPGTG